MNKEALLGEGIDERARLRELLSLHVLDTPPEERFDRYTRLVADIFDVPTVLISLVDDKRQWFKSRVGLNACETPRDVAFCAHALAHELLEVPDAARDPRFKTNPLVTGPPYIRFYAGAVVHGPTGQPLGTLCLIDSRPRTLTQSERWRLKTFARLVEQELDVNSRLEELQDSLRYSAFYDAVTGLPQRWVVKEHLERILHRLGHQRRPVAVMHLHVVNLEETIAVHGNATGDVVLRELGARLQALAGVTDVIGRQGADRFLFIMPGLGGRAETAQCVRRIIESLSRPVEHEGAALEIKVSAGVSSAPMDVDAGNNADAAGALLDCARTALLRPSTGGERGDAFQFYSRQTHDWVSRRHDKVHRLRQALKHDKLCQLYQPVVQLDSQRIVGVEALARWTDERFGVVSPAEFVPLAEEDNRMRRALTQWALRTACRQAAQWYARLGASLWISVNIPALELCRDDFVELIRAALDESKLAGDQLVLELTEDSLIANRQAAVAAIQTLREAGVRFSLDDFGTGYSSLSYLQKLPLDSIKIDRSFVSRVAEDAPTNNLTRSIVDIARVLALDVIAEGIEEKVQLDTLKRLRCQRGQGFLFSRPVAAQTIVSQLTRAGIERRHALGTSCKGW